jgi:hypothetical protein
MNEWVGRWPDSLVSTDTTLDCEFEERLRDSSGLAFNIAYGVLRNGPMRRKWRRTRSPGRFGASGSCGIAIGFEPGSRE